MLIQDLADMPAEEIRSVFGIERSEGSVVVVRVALRDAMPPIWRLLHLPGDTTLVQLHYYIQDVMDWHDAHLYEFVVTKGRDSMPFPKRGTGESALPSELSATLQSLHADGIKEFKYIYDFGDYWVHDITVRSVKSPKDGEAVPALIGGEGAAPPEDCGGIYQFSYLRKQLEGKQIKPSDDDWMSRAIAETSFEFAGEVKLSVASNAPPIQNEWC